MEDQFEKDNVSSDLKDEFKQIIESSGAKVIPAKKYNIPDSYDLSRFNFSGPDESLVKEAINLYKEYLVYSIISDNFPGHDERRDWRKNTYKTIKESGGIEKADKFDGYLKRNKMKRNKIAQLVGYSDLLREIGAIPDNLGNKLMSELRDTLPDKKTGADPWEGPTTPEKIQQVESISNSVADVLRYFGPQSQS